MKKNIQYLQCVSNDVPDLSSRLLLLAELPPLGGLAAHVGVAVGGGARHSLPHIPAHSQVRSDAGYRTSYVPLVEFEFGFYYHLCIIRTMKY